MHQSLESLCASLEALSAAVTSAWTGEQTCNEAWGWNCPTLTRHDLAALPNRIACRIKEANLDEVDSELLEQVNDWPRRLQIMQTTTVAQIFTSNCSAASVAYIGTLESLEKVLTPLFAWQAINDNKIMPAQLAKRIRSLNAEIAQITPDKDALTSQIKLIKDATEAAETLPTDLLALKDAREKISNLAIDAAILYDKIDDKLKSANISTGVIANHQTDAEKLVKKCEEAYRITTTTGLAGAFDQRAANLGRSMRMWVAGLLVALVAGAALGFHRVDLLSNAIQQPDPKWGAIWMNLTLSILSIGGPLWFAWLATKQIGQRFRLTEDYAYKATVAKAYEGYRKEALRLDPSFEARLFSSALSRLEEAPLRLVEAATHGSPWHELIASKLKKPASTQPSEAKENQIAEVEVSSE